jgi:ribosome-binding protein aMBF1 (putative translation factor)
MGNICKHPIHTDYGCDIQGNVYTRKNSRWGYLPDGEWKLMKQTPAIKGKYTSVKINGATTLVHRFVAQTFLPNPNNKPQINHINNIGTDNRVENLEWVTSAENIQHRYDLGGHNNQKITPIQREYIRTQRKTRGYTYQRLANVFGVTKQQIRRICI